MSVDFDYSIKFPTVQFSAPREVSLSAECTLSRRKKTRGSQSDSEDEVEDVVSEPIEILSDREPVVLLLGWLGCRETYLSKYGDIYYHNGCVVIQYLPAADDIYFNRSRVREHAAKLLELLEEMQLLESPLIIHLFSNAGAIMYLNILELLQEPGCELTSQVKIVGVVWDSAPGKPRIGSGKRAYLNQMPHVSGFLRSVIGIVFVVILFFMSIWNNLLSLIGVRRSPNFFKQLQKHKVVCPQLFLYSKCDDLIYYKDVEEMIACLKQAGCAVTTISWEDSPHVQHLRYHVDSYTKQCVHFIQSCVAAD